MNLPTSPGMPKPLRRGVDRRGDVVGGRYRLSRSLGAKHGVDIWAGEDTRFQRDVVVKVCSRFERGSERLEEEACRLARVPSGIAPTVFAEGSEEGISYLAMELVSGEGLTRLLRQFDLPARLSVAKSITAAVVSMHAVDIAHGHLDLDHVFVDKIGVGQRGVRILGFGGWEGRLPIGPSGSDDTEGTSAKRGDLVALGYVLHRLLGGKIDKPTGALLASSDLAGIEERAAVCHVVDRAISKDEKDFYPSASALLEDLCRAIDLPPASYQVGEIVDHRFRILGLLGRGGMGAVYEVEDLQKALPGELVLKVAAPPSFDFDARRTCRRRFQREREALETLADWDVPGVHVHGDSGGYPYMVMEKVDGVDLRAAVHLACEANDWPAVLQMFRDLAQTLDAAHRLHIIHRDIKPANILVDQQTRAVRVLDFGIAGAPDSELTRGGALGTSGFQAPEQIYGHAVAASDQWSLAACLYYALAGLVPGERSAHGELPTSERRELAADFLVDGNAITPLRELPGLESVPRRVDLAVSKALSPSSKDRFATCRDFVDAMDLSGLSRLGGKWRDLRRQAQRPLVLGFQERLALATGFLLIGIALLVSLWR